MSFRANPQSPNSFQTSIYWIQPTVQYFYLLPKTCLPAVKNWTRFTDLLPTGVVCLSGEYKSLITLFRMTSLPPRISPINKRKGNREYVIDACNSVLFSV